MARRWPALAWVALGVAASLFLLLFGMVLLTASRGSPLAFWLSEIVTLVLVWRAITSRLGLRAAGETRRDGGHRTLRVATAASAVLFFALWLFAVAFSGGQVGLAIILAYVIASGAFLFLVSIRNRVTSVDYAIRMPLVAAGAIAMVAIGLFYLGGGTL